MIEEGAWIEFYKKTYNQSRENAKFSWDMVKFYVLTSSAFITVTLGATTFIIGNKSLIEKAPTLSGIGIISLSIFPIFMIVILNIGEASFTREAEQHYRNIAILMKLEERLGLTSVDRVEKEKRIFKMDKNYVPCKWINDGINYDTEEDFIKGVMSESNKYFSNSIAIFRWFKVFSGIIIILLFLIGSLVITNYQFFI